MGVLITILKWIWTYLLGHKSCVDIERCSLRNISCWVLAFFREAGFGCCCFKCIWTTRIIIPDETQNIKPFSDISIIYRDVSSFHDQPSFNSSLSFISCWRDEMKLKLYGKKTAFVQIVNKENLLHFQCHNEDSAITDGATVTHNLTCSKHMTLMGATFLRPALFECKLKNDQFNFTLLAQALYRIGHRKDPEPSYQICVHHV